jgi:3',5'-cyclic AMP phosphodiesterase CpdA
MNKRTLTAFIFLLFAGCSTQYLKQGERKFVIVGLPDTQYYSCNHPDIFDSQTQWIVDNRKNIDFVIHLGDVVQSYDKIKEWENARRSMSKLKGKVPYMVIPGNHDNVSISLYNFKKYISSKTNDCKLVMKGQDSLVILGMQWNPDSTVLQWANDMLDYYSWLPAIVFTHEYMDVNSRRSAIGEGIWQNLISKHNNVFLVMSGHWFGSSEKIDTLDNNLIFQHLYNYQHLKNGGDGWLRIYTIMEDEIEVKTYSPYLKQFKQEECFTRKR